MKRILVALDSSPRAPRIRDEAVSIAHATNAKLRLIRAVTLPPDLPGALFNRPPDRMVQDISANARRDLEALAEPLPPELVDGIDVGVGAAWSVICDASAEHDVDLVVVGAHGYGTLDRVLGTTAAKIVNHIDRSVLVVRPRPASQ